MDSPRYVRTFFIGISTLLLGAGSFSWLIDPYLMYGTPRFAGINAVKSEFITHTRLGKAYVVRRLKPKAIVLGSSRSEHGIDPDHPGWSGATPRYNLALSAANTREILAYMRHAQSIGGLQQIVLGLDFYMFNAHFANRPDFDDSILSDGRIVSEIVAVLKMPQAAISSSGIRSGIETIRSQRTGMDEVDENGRRNSQSLDNVLKRRHGHRGAFLASEEEFLRNTYLPLPRRRYDFEDEGGHSTLADFREIVRLAHRERIDLVLFISPSHARQWELVRVLGLWQRFEQWKRELVGIVAKEAQGSSGAMSVELWDFSGYNSVSTEPVPAPGDETTKMRWYWESSHYRKEVGDLVLDRVLRYRGSPRSVPADFGVLLDTTNIEYHLARIRDEQREYHRRYPGDAAEIRALAQKVQANVSAPGQ